MKATKLIGTTVAVAALAAGLAAPTAALADGDRWEHGSRYYGAPYGKAHGYWKQPHVRYYAPAYVVRPYRPPVVVYPAPVYSAPYPVYSAPYPVYPGGQFTFSYSAGF